MEPDSIVGDSAGKGRIWVGAARQACASGCSGLCARTECGGSVASVRGRPAKGEARVAAVGLSMTLWHQRAGPCVSAWRLVRSSSAARRCWEPVRSRRSETTHEHAPVQRSDCAARLLPCRRAQRGAGARQQPLLGSHGAGSARRFEKFRTTRTHARQRVYVLQRLPDERV
jgi:hypothetical protein